MTRKLLFAAASAALLTASAVPAFAGAGAIGAAREQLAQRAENGDRGRGNGGGNNGGGERRQEAPQRNNDGGGRQFQGNAGNGGGAGQIRNRGDGAGQRQAQQQPRPQQDFRNNNGAGQRQAQQQPRPQQDFRNNGGGNDNGRQFGGQNGDNNRWAGQPQPRPQPPQAFRNGDNQRRVDNNQPNNNDRRWDNNNRNDDRRFTGNNNDRRVIDNNRRVNNGWNYRWNDNRSRRSYAAIPYGGYFGPSYGSIVSRYYGRNYVYYGSRSSWGGGWNRPYRVGYLLPPALYCTEVPYDLYYDLPPPPYGYDYALCGRDILLVGLDSNLVIDAIVGWY